MSAGHSSRQTADVANTARRAVPSRQRYSESEPIP